MGFAGHLFGEFCLLTICFASSEIGSSASPVRAANLFDAQRVRGPDEGLVGLDVELDAWMCVPMRRFGCLDFWSFKRCRAFYVPR